MVMNHLVEWTVIELLNKFPNVMKAKVNELLRQIIVRLQTESHKFSHYSSKVSFLET
jgi:hypothetical protein